MAVKRAPRRDLVDPEAEHQAQVQKAIEQAEAAASGREELVRLGTPTFDRMVVQELPPEELTAGKIFLPPSAQKARNAGPRGNPIRGRVLVLGPGMVLESGDVLDVFAHNGIRVGSVVTWHEFGGTCIDRGLGLHVVSAQDTIYVESDDWEPEASLDEACDEEG